MKRRSFLSLAAAGFAGCSGGGGGGPGTAQKGDGAKQIGGNSAKVSAFLSALEDKGVDVDSSMKAAGNLSVMYFRRPDHERQDLARIGTTYTQHLGVSESFLNLTAIEPDGQSRYGTYIIKESWARGYANGDLTKTQYLNKIESTFKKK